MQTVKNKFKNIKNERLRSIHKELTSSRFISSFKNIKKPGTYKCSGKRCKICQNYLNETNKFIMSNGQVWEICREIDCH